MHSARRHKEDEDHEDEEHRIHGIHRCHHLTDERMELRDAACKLEDANHTEGLERDERAAFDAEETHRHLGNEHAYSAFMNGPSTAIEQQYARIMITTVVRN